MPKSRLPLRVTTIELKKLKLSGRKLNKSKAIIRKGSPNVTVENRRKLNEF